MPASKDKRHASVLAQQLRGFENPLQPNVLTRCLGHNKHQASNDDSGNGATTESHRVLGHKAARVCAQELCRIESTVRQHCTTMASWQQFSSLVCRQWHKQHLRNCPLTRQYLCCYCSKSCRWDKSRNSQENWVPVRKAGRTRQTGVIPGCVLAFPPHTSMCLNCTPNAQQTRYTA